MYYKYWSYNNFSLVHPENLRDNKKRGRKPPKFPTPLLPYYQHKPYFTRKSSLVCRILFP